LKTQDRQVPSGQVLPAALLSCVQVSVGGVIQPIQQSELGFHIPMPRHIAVLVTEVGQHRHQPLVVIKDQSW
jgi:hypothetical protein